MVPLAGIIDVAFLGHLADIRYLAGVSLATIIFNYIYWSFGFLRMVTTGVTAQAMGRDDPQEVWLIGLRNSSMAIALGLGILVFQQPLRELGFFLLSATPDVEIAGRAFFNARIWGAPATLFNFVLIGWFLGREQAGKVLILSIVGNGANVILDYWMIMHLGWGSAGAGLATALSQYLMALVGLLLLAQEGALRRFKSFNRSGLRRVLWDWPALRRIFRLNTDILVRTLALVSAFSIFTNLSAVLGTTVLAVNTLMLQVVTLAAYFIDGFAFATESFAGLFYGQGDRHQLVPLLRLSGGLSLMVGLAFALVFVLAPDALFGQLTSHTDIVIAVRDVVGWLIPVLGFGAIAFVLDGYFLGLTQGRVLRNASVIAAVLGFAPMALLAWHQRNGQLLWLALALFMAARGITLGVRVPETLQGRSLKP